MIELFVSEEIYAEYEEVIRRPRLKRHADAIEGVLRTIREKAVWECVPAAEADYLVTGNSKDFPAVWQTTRIVTARKFMEVFAGAQRRPS